MGIAERRAALLGVLCRRRHETIPNLAAELGVSVRTIRRDIELLSLEVPIYTQTGRYGGGVYVTENFQLDRRYFNGAELSLLEKIIACAKRKMPYLLNSEEIRIMQQILSNYTKPQTIKRKKGFLARSTANSEIHSKTLTSKTSFTTKTFSLSCICWIRS